MCITARNGIRVFLSFSYVLSYPSFTEGSDETKPQAGVIRRNFTLLGLSSGVAHSSVVGWLLVPASLPSSLAMAAGF